jgi:hypothetical protein
MFLYMYICYHLIFISYFLYHYILFTNRALPHIRITMFLWINKVVQCSVFSARYKLHTLKFGTIENFHVSFYISCKVVIGL